MYDLELLIESKESSLVRSHLTKGRNEVDWTLYRGSKSLFVQLDPGMYEIKFI